MSAESGNAALELGAVDAVSVEAAPVELAAVELVSVGAWMGVTSTVLFEAVVLSVSGTLRTLRTLGTLGVLRVSGMARVIARTTARAGTAALLARAEAHVVGVHGPSFLGAPALAAASHECPAQSARVEFLMLVVMIVMASHE
ncbi:hypothetical protein [Brachybacterium kimchii]|uniref:Uncharacterized protein n=1 Tax=Brachybacterium kimchii TaxID=2942909 RepID=A0ABY4N722_9MICO|nr:hypothetical protein [Brachybacterium kimchii]UQN28960.1 hypothetical protein M4486_15190 [Brachybacterium kimchii]